MIKKKLSFVFQLSPDGTALEEPRQLIRLFPSDSESSDDQPGSQGLTNRDIQEAIRLVIEAPPEPTRREMGEDYISPALGLLQFPTEKRKIWSKKPALPAFVSGDEALAILMQKKEETEWIKREKKERKEERMRHAEENQR